MAANIKLVRLLSGEDILGEVLDTNDKSVIIKNAVRVVVIPNKATPDQPGVAFAPFSHWTKDTELELFKPTILALMNPIPEFINQYNATFGGLVVPDNKLILPGK
jgi:hypothetical protein